MHSRANTPARLPVVRYNGRKWNERGDGVTRRPNIIFMISHDTGRQLGCYGRDVDTPALDALALEGIRFDQAFCCAPQCSPSRSGIATGVYPHRNGMMGLAHIGWSMPVELPKLPERMAGAGYRTVLVGVQHEGIEDDRRHGYQRIVKPEKGRDSAPEVGALAARTLEELAQGGGDAPFYLAVGFWETHRPFDARRPGMDEGDRSVPPYLPNHPDICREMGHFAHSARILDDGVRVIVDAVDRLGMAADTLLVYTTDHGIAFPRAKGTLFDPGLETALIMRWKGTLEAGKQISDLVCNVDLFPTLCELAGADCDGQEAAQSGAPRAAQGTAADLPGEGLDGRSFAGALLGRGEFARDHLFAELTWHDAYSPVRGIRTRDHKYIRHFARGPSVYIPLDIHTGLAGQAVREGYYASECVSEELYDLRSDPHELVNVAGRPDCAPLQAELRARLERWMAQTQDPLLHGPVAGREAPGWANERASGTMPF